jgi:hypothetical protein
MGIGILTAIAVLFFAFAQRKERVVVVERSATSPLASQSPSPELTPTSTPTTSPTSMVLVNPLTAEPCTNAARRPMAVMLSGDAIARPLSGIQEADMVFEMPVITGSITRFMAVFICRDPIEIGSVRSARHDFIPLARSLDAIFVHWGGSHFALDILKKGAIDNIDALPNPTGAFWRKESAVAPHNGFTSMTRLFKAATFLQYRLESASVSSYPHITQTAYAENASGPKGSLEVGFTNSHRVRYEYDPQERFYARIRGGVTERDRNSNEPVKVRNIVVMRATSRQIEDQYNDVVLEGGGDAIVYRNGEEITGKWKKDKDPASKLMFFDMQGEEIAFLSGNIWVEIVEPYTDVNWVTE